MRLKSFEKRILPPCVAVVGAKTSAKTSVCLVHAVGEAGVIGNLVGNCLLLRRCLESSDLSPNKQRWLGVTEYSYAFGT